MRDEIKPYYEILRWNPDLFNAAVDACGDEEDGFTALSAYVTAPVLFFYVWWVLQKAMQNRLKRLFFLARDGYVMYRIARVLCEKFKLPVQCSYFCVSRYTLRMAAYGFKDDSAYELLFQHCASMTPRHLLLRAGLTPAEQAMIYNNLDYPADQADVVMSHLAFDDFCDRLRMSRLFQDFVQRHSWEANQRFVAYCRQEGMLDYERFGIVDTGWTGSMQYTLSNILSRVKPGLEITGYYFGLYSTPKNAQRGTYYTYYFTPDSRLSRITKFNNNLFECMCAAPHGMTVDYQEDNQEHMVPVFSKDESVGLNRAAVERQIAVVDAFTASLAGAMTQFEEFVPRNLRNMTERLLRRVMFHPDAAAAEAFGRFVFCDDISEAYHQKLAEPASPQQLSAYLIHRRLLARFRRRRGIAAQTTDLFWCYGSLALSQCRCHWWYHCNMHGWDLLRYTVDRLRHKKNAKK